MKGTVVASVVTVAILIGAGAGFLVGTVNGRTVTSVSTRTFVSSTTVVSQGTSTATLIRTTTSTVTVGATTSTVTVAERWWGLNFMVNASSCAVSTDPPTTWYESPCFGVETNGTSVVVFNCAAAAATKQGCTQRVNTTGQGAPQPAGPHYFAVTVWYPYINYSLYPGVNCRFTEPSVPAPPGPGPPIYAYCISFNSTSFIVAEQAPGPT